MRHASVHILSQTTPADGERPGTKLPRDVASAAETAASAQTEAELHPLLHGSPIPIVLVDDDRRYVEANGPARLAFRLNLGELRKRRIDDLTSPALVPMLEKAWERMARHGIATAGAYEVEGGNAGSWTAVYHALRAALPGLYVIAFAPAGWPEEELAALAATRMHLVDDARAKVSPREREVVDLLAAGLTGEEIGVRLGVAPDTVRTHIRNTMRRVGAKTRPHLVAIVLRQSEGENPG